MVRKDKKKSSKNSNLTRLEQAVLNFGKLKLIQAKEKGTNHDL